MSERQNAAFPNRVFYIDNLRVFLIMLVICHHLAIGFGAPGGWYYAPHAAVLCHLRRAFTVCDYQPVFHESVFLCLGLFHSGLLKKKGVKNFLYDRLLRLGIPLAAYYFIFESVCCLYQACSEEKGTAATCSLCWERHINTLAVGRSGLFSRC